MDNGTTIPQAKVDLKKLQEYIDNKLINTQKHDKFDLLIHNYTPKCQYDKIWDEYTMSCRGLITDLNGNIISRPFKKFFNLGEYTDPNSKLPPLNWKQGFCATEKFDGSLGILYPTPDGYKIATRGSFNSDQAIEATKMLQNITHNFYPNYTYLFEIIYPENRIVIDYGKNRSLTLLDVIDTFTGQSVYNFEKFAKELNCYCVFDLGLKQSELEKITGNNREGIVVRFDDGTRIKIKIEEYVRLHRLITGCSSKTIWEHLKEGRPFDELLDRVPDEFYDWVKETSEDLQKQYEEIDRDCQYDFGWIFSQHGHDRKEFAEFARKHAYPQILFSLLDKKDHSQIIWKMLKPAFSKPFHQDIDS